MIGVIADDLTGAAEIGAIGWRYGLRSEILGMAPRPMEADLVCINTDSRSLSPASAAGRAALAAETLLRGGARWTYKKVDSVLRGHVIAEARAVVNRLGLHSALIIPANPNRGRVVRDGRYFVKGAPIHETEFGNDPEYPCRSSNVLDLLGNPGEGGVQVQAAGTELPPEGIVLGEAGSDEDLRAWVAQRSPSILVGGAAEFFEALLKAELEVTRAGARGSAADGPTGPALFVCGTRSESAGRFIQSAQRAGAPVFKWPEGPALESGTEEQREADLGRRIVEVLHSQPGVLVTGFFARAPASGESGRIARRLAHLSCAILNECTVSHVFAEGGATASCLLSELGWDRLRVVSEVAPGVVTLESPGGRGPLLTLKPGSYVWPETIQRRLVRGVEPAPMPERAAAGSEP